MITTELFNHVEELNTKAQAWMSEAPEGSFRMAALYTYADILDRVKHNGVKTPADWDALCAWEDYYDLYKDVEGISPRWTKWSDNTSEGWQELIKEL